MNECIILTNMWITKQVLQRSMSYLLITQITIATANNNINNNSPGAKRSPKPTPAVSANNSAPQTPKRRRGH